MSSIVIIHSLSRARHFLSAQPRHLLGNGRYLAFPTSTTLMVIKFLEDLGIKAFLPGPISKEGRDKFLRDYIDIMDVLADQNGHELQWWATDLASKNRFTSPLFGLLDALVRCHDAIDKVSGQGQLLVLVHPPWPVVLSLENSAKICEWDLKIISSPFSKFLARYRGKVKTWMSVVMGFFSSLFRIWEVRRYFGPMHRKKEKNKPIYLIKSFVYPGSFSKDGLFHDSFFGKLSEFLERSIGDKVDIFTVAVGAENRNKCYQRMKSLKGQQIVPLEAFLRYSDVFKALLHIWWRCITKPFRTVNKLSFLGNEISGLVKECLSSGGWRIKLYQYLHLFAAERTVRTYRLYACALTFEGNPWERMFVEGLRRHFPEAPIFGYQHAVVPQAAAGVFISPREKKYSPLPSIVLTTGEVPSGIMRHYGMLSDDCIRPACALRYDYLYNIDYREKKKGRFLVLVALEGVLEVLPLLEYVFDQAPKCSNAFFRIRAHPVMPLPEVLSRLGRRIDPEGNIETSSGGTVVSDVEKSSAILYWGTTVALEALMMGKPLIHFDRGDLLSYDPLFEFNDFKWTVGKNKDLHTVLEEIRNLSDEKHAVLSERGRNYISSYFNKVNEKSMSKFLPEIH